LIVLLCSSFSAQGAFFNIDQQEKHLMIACGLDLYLKKNDIDCADLKRGITTILYNKFINDFRVAYDPTHENPDWKESLPEVYQTFDNFKNNIQEICENGESACRTIKGGTYNRSRFQRKTCNTLCSTRTCKDLFTLSTCHAMSENQIDEQDICPPETVKNCLSKNIPNLETALRKRGWPQEWANIDEYWDHIFLGTAPEIAPGRTSLYRAEEIVAATVAIGGAVAVMAFLPSLIVVIAPGATAGIKYVKGQVKNLVVSQVSNAANKGLNYAGSEITTKAQKGGNIVKKDAKEFRDQWDSPTHGMMVDF
jgi:hypothetical protein